MSRQDKATTDRNARLLRDLVKQPDNKACADCRKNDARWASWNLGVFLCIRCSGIHRSMGTHISKVKSIDLDIWTPEQMENVQRWGNKRANLYWERHLKTGHVPPEHKIESFIRSKYESRRWAMEGPVPKDPSVLDGGEVQAPSPVDTTTRPTPTSTAPPPAASSKSQVHPLLSRSQVARPTPAPASAPAPMLDIFGDDSTPTPDAATAALPQITPVRPQPAQATVGIAAPGPTAPAAAAIPSSNLFDLDFRAPTPASAKPQSAKADIMSLFSTQSPHTAPASTSIFQTDAAPPTRPQMGTWNGGGTSTAPPVQQNATQTPLPLASEWGGLQMDPGGWSQPVSQGTPATAAGAWATNDPWGGQGGFGSMSPQVVKKEEKDPFANIWQ